MKIARLLGLAALGFWVVPGLAQPQGRPMQGGARPPMGGRMRSEKMRLPRLVEGAARLSGANALSKKQAKQMVHLVSPWRSRPTMSEDAGKKLFASLTGTLSSAQKAAMQNDRPRFGGGGRDGGGRDGGRMGGPGGRMGGPGGRMGGPGGGPGGGRGMGGGMRPSGAQMDKMRAAMASFNPLYSGTPAGFSSMPAPFKERMTQQRNRLNSALSQLQQKAR